MEIKITKISKRLRTLREQKQFTQEELANALGVSRQ
jgi:transcriptional regulator with XRE-family HTH domain